MARSYEPSPTRARYASAEIADVAASTSGSGASGWSARRRAVCSSSSQPPLPASRRSRRGALRIVELGCIAPLARTFAGAVKPLEALLAAFRSGERVPYADYGDDLHEGQAAFAKPLFENLLAKEWLPGAPEIHERLLLSNERSPHDHRAAKPSNWATLSNTAAS